MCSLTRCGLYIQGAGNQRNAFPHAQQTEASSPTVVTIHVKSYSIIADHELEPVLQSLELDTNVLGLGMPRNVRQAFLCDAVQAGDNVLRQAFGYFFAYEPGIDTGTGLKVIDEASERNG